MEYVITCTKNLFALQAVKQWTELLTGVTKDSIFKAIEHYLRLSETIPRNGHVTLSFLMKRASSNDKFCGQLFFDEVDTGSIVKVSAVISLETHGFILEEDGAKQFDPEMESLFKCVIQQLLELAKADAQPISCASKNEPRASRNEPRQRGRRDQSSRGYGGRGSRGGRRNNNNYSRNFRPRDVRDVRDGPTPDKRRYSDRPWSYFSDQQQARQHQPEQRRSARYEQRQDEWRNRGHNQRRRNRRNNNRRNNQQSFVCSKCGHSNQPTREEKKKPQDEEPEEGEILHETQEKEEKREATPSKSRSRSRSRSSKRARSPSPGHSPAETNVTKESSIRFTIKH